MNTQLTAREPQTVMPTSTLWNLVTSWLAEIDATNATKDAYHLGLSRFIAWLDGRQASAALIRRWRDMMKEQYSLATVNARLSAVRCFYTWAVSTGRMSNDPAAGVEGAEQSGDATDHEREALTPEQLAPVMAACDPNTVMGARDRALIALMAYTCLRPIDLHRANVGDLCRNDGCLLLRLQGASCPDTNSAVALSDVVERELRHWLTVRPGYDDDPLFVSLSRRNAGARLSRRAIRAVVKARSRAAGMTGNSRNARLHMSPAPSHEIFRLQTPTEDMVSFLRRDRILESR